MAVFSYAHALLFQAGVGSEPRILATPPDASRRLPGTEPLETEKDIASELVSGVDRFLPGSARPFSVGSIKVLDAGLSLACDIRKARCALTERN